eukprot:TRINITY_DN3279_c7_g2_i1.p1 TRINITY_DN3279_c7_g2~~TRINITY_DN3279_c7_g2_i1.p1  ORF type:complete len:695 (-),score=233.91 TRINITY_DN3279_c7_g2_i1:323-2407(-)
MTENAHETFQHMLGKLRDDSVVWYERLEALRYLQSAALKPDVIEILKANLDDVLNSLSILLHSDRSSVLQSVLLTIGSISDTLRDDIGPYVLSITESLIDLIDNSNNETIIKSAICTLTQLVCVCNIDEGILALLCKKLFTENMSLFQGLCKVLIATLERRVDLDFIEKKLLELNISEESLKGEHLKKVLDKVENIRKRRSNLESPSSPFLNASSINTNSSTISSVLSHHKTIKSPLSEVVSKSLDTDHLIKTDVKTNDEHFPTEVSSAILETKKFQDESKEIHLKTFPLESKKSLSPVEMKKMSLQQRIMRLNGDNDVENDKSIEEDGIKLNFHISSPVSSSPSDIKKKLEEPTGAAPSQETTNPFFGSNSQNRLAMLTSRVNTMLSPERTDKEPFEKKHFANESESFSDLALSPNSGLLFSVSTPDSTLIESDDTLIELKRKLMKVEEDLRKERKGNKKLTDVLYEYELTIVDMVDKQNAEVAKQTHALMEELNETRASNVELQNKFKQLHFRYMSTKEIVQTLQDNERTLQNSLSDLRERYNNLRTQAESKLVSANELVNEMKESESKFKLTISELTEKNAEKDEHINKQKKELVLLQNKLNAMQQKEKEMNEIKEMQSEAQVILEENKKLKVELYDLKYQQAKHNDEENSLKQKISSLEAENKSIMDFLENTVSKMEVLKSENDLLKRRK